MKQIKKRILNCLSPVHFKSTEAIHAIVGGEKPVSMSKWDHEAITNSALFDLLNEGLIVPGKTTKHTFRRATHEEKVAFLNQLNVDVTKLQIALTDKFQYRATLEKKSGIPSVRQFDRAMSIIQREGIVAYERCHGKNGSKYRRHSEEEREEFDKLQERRAEQKRERDNANNRRKEEVRWREVAVRDALDIGWTRFKKLRGKYAMNYNFETNKWEFSYKGDTYSFSVSIGRQITLDFGDIEVEATCLYNFIQILQGVRSYRRNMEQIGRVGRVCERSLFGRRSPREAAREAAFTLHIEKGGRYNASGWTWTDKEVA